jgi:phosphoenolpyruvate synthase/pyruvate phosphate dikinase
MGIPAVPEGEMVSCHEGWVLADDEILRPVIGQGPRRNWSERFQRLAELGHAWQRFSRPGREYKRLFRWLNRTDRARQFPEEGLSTLSFQVAASDLMRPLKRVATSIVTRWPSTLGGFRAEVSRIHSAVRDERHPEELVSLGDHLRQAAIDYIRPEPTILAIRVAATRFISEIGRRLGFHDTSAFIADLAKGLPGNPYLHIHSHLIRLSGLIFSEIAPTAALQTQDLPDHSQERLKIFLSDFGFLSADWDFRHPAWGEMPAVLLHTLFQLHGQSHLDLGGAKAQREAVEADFRGRLFSFPLVDQLAMEALDIFRHFLILHVEHHFFLRTLIPPARQLVLKLGRILRDRGGIGSAEDVFWLHDQEVREHIRCRHSFSLAQLVEQRKEAHRQACRGTLQVQASSAGAAATASSILRGEPVSPGMARGRVRKIAHHQDLKALQPGEILFVRSPNPFFTMTFSHISGLLAESGTALSHGGLLIREFGKPAVFQLPGAWHRIQDGAEVELNGTTGEVHLLREKPH